MRKDTRELFAFTEHKYEYFLVTVAGLPLHDDVKETRLGVFGGSSAKVDILALVCAMCGVTTLRQREKDLYRRFDSAVRKCV